MVGDHPEGDVAPFGFRTVTFAGMPGVVFADGGTGLVENSGGKLFASILILALAGSVSAVAFALFTIDVFGAPPPQPTKMNAVEIKEIQITVLNISFISSDFENSCAGLKVASPEGSDGVQTGTGRYQTNYVTGDAATKK